MNNFVVKNISVNKLISEKNIHTYYDIKKIKNINDLNISGIFIYNFYVSGNIYTNNDIRVFINDNYLNKLYLSSTKDILIDGNLYIFNKGDIDLIDAIAYTTIPNRVYRREKINKLKNKINEKGKGI